MNDPEEENDEEGDNVVLATSEEESATETEIPKDYLKVVTAINSAREDQAAALSEYVISICLLVFIWQLLS